MKHDQTSFGFYKGQVRVARNYWQNVFHVEDMEGMTVLPGEQPPHFTFRVDAERWAILNGFEIIMPI